MNKIRKPGKVFLVGAGPGDPGLLTIKAYNLLKACDVVIYDALLNPEIINYTSEWAEKIFIGKSRHKERITQDEVQKTMIQRASEGLKVVRLKGGDPFIFGRGGEEAEALTSAGIPWEIVPGVTSGIAVAAYAAIPLTHRDCASSVTFITGHDCNKKPGVNWNQIRKEFNTLVIYMGVSNIQKIISGLLESDYVPDTPIAIIECGTMHNQRIRTGTLDTIIGLIEQDPVHTPALIVIGDVVKYREKLLSCFAPGHMETEILDRESV